MLQTTSSFDHEYQVTGFLGKYRHPILRIIQNPQAGTDPFNIALETVEQDTNSVGHDITSETKKSVLRQLGKAWVIWAVHKLCFHRAEVIYATIFTVKMRN